MVVSLTLNNETPHARVGVWRVAHLATLPPHRGPAGRQERKRVGVVVGVWNRRLVAVAVAGCAVGLVGCGGGPQPTPTVDPRQQLVHARTEVAPSVTYPDSAFQVTAAAHRGGFAVVDVMVVQAAAGKLDGSDVSVRLSDGRTVTASMFAGVDLPASSKTTAQLVVPGVGAHDPSVQVSLGAGQPFVQVPLPEEGHTFVWRGAPIRQAALDPEPHRDPSAEVSLDVVRSEGLVSELAYRASAWNGKLELCDKTTAPLCNVTEPDGTVHPLIGVVPTAAADERVDGVLRFVGALNPGSKWVDVSLPTRSGDKPVPIRVEVPDHASSQVRPITTDLSRTSQPDFKAVVMTLPSSTTRITVDKVDVFADRVQVHMVAAGGKTPTDLIGGPRDNWLALVEPDGYRHVVDVPAGMKLVVPAGGKLEATVSFAGAVPASVASLDLSVRAPGQLMTSTEKVVLPPAGNPQSAGQAPLGFGAIDKVTPPATPDAPNLPTTAPDVSSGVAVLNVATDLFDGSTGTVVPREQTVIAGTNNTAGVQAPAGGQPTTEAEAQKSLKDLGAQKTATGYVLTLPETVLFDYNQSAIKPQAAATLTKVAQLLRYYDKVLIGVNGYTDNTGTAEYNLVLSQRRAQAVADSFVGQGVKKERMKVTGFGMAQPAVANDTDANRAKNRRVQIVLRENT